jgi:hypothetical protein
MNAQVLTTGSVIPSEGTSNVTMTLLNIRPVCLSGVSSAHAVEPTALLTVIAKMGDFAAVGSDAKAAASLSANLSRARVACPRGIG